MEHIKLRPQCTEDDEFLFELFVNTRPDLLALSCIGEEEHQQFLQQQFRMEKAQLDKKGSDNQQVKLIDQLVCHELNIVLYDDMPIGKFYISTEADHYHIGAIALIPQFQARGIGSELMKRLMTTASLKALPITLQVAWYNYGAKAFYEKMGFHTIRDCGAFCEMMWP